MPVAEDGTGFYHCFQQQAPALPNMRNVAASINAGLSIITAPGYGTIIKVVIGKQS